MKRLLPLLLLFLTLFSGCDLARGINLPISLVQVQPTTQVTPDSAQAGPGSTQAGAEPSQTPGTPSAGPSATPVRSLMLWVPPDFDPQGTSPASTLLRERLATFSRENGGVLVDVRVKASGGAGGLLESLNAYSAVAPMALPSVVALSRADLETAALKGLVIPLDGVSKLIDQPDWYNYARQLAKVQGATFALPFAGDALVLAYRPAKVTGPPHNWAAVVRMGQPLAFPAADSQALFMLLLYQSVGGMVEDAQGRPALQPDLLSQVLQVMAEGEQRGMFPYWLSQYETDGQVWQAYRDQRVQALVTWVSNYLSSQPADTIAAPIPAMKETTLTLATGWGWAVADPIPERRALSIKLAEYLSQSDFLAKWTEAAGFLPTRPSALSEWSSASLKTLLSPVAVSAQARPAGDQLASLGPVLKEATLKVLKRESDPTQAAKAASERLVAPETK